MTARRLRRGNHQSEFVVAGSTCEVQIGAQTGLGPVTYTKTVDGASCPLTGTGVKTDGVIGGGLKIKAGSTKTLEPIAFGIE